MPLIFGFDIGTTSIGFAVIEHDRQYGTGKIMRLGVRIFPESRDPKGTPLNQERRAARLRRRQLRRRRERRCRLRNLLNQADLLPVWGSPDWDEVMKSDPYDLRRRAFEGETLTPHEIGRAIYHLAQRRHFKGRDIDEISDEGESNDKDTDDKKAKSSRDETIQALQRTGKTLGAWLADRDSEGRKRGEHATREIVEEEFNKVWVDRLPKNFQEPVRNAIFDQQPTFWRLNTLGKCPFFPNAPLCPKGSWLSQQRRMLEKLNNLSLVGIESRCLNEEERQAILAKLQIQTSMTWAGVRRALAPLYKSRGIPGEQKKLKFNLEEGGEEKLFGNAVEAKLASLFGSDWDSYPRKQEVRDAIQKDLWEADYEKIGDQRVNILPAPERKSRRAEVVCRFAKEFGLSDDQAVAIEGIKLPSGWEPYSVEALQEILPHLEVGTRFGEIVNGPGWESWRAETFPNREQPTGEILDRLPSPANLEERKYVAGLRNPTVVRTRNELRKVANNLIEMFGKPDLVRVELTRDVGNSKREREEKSSGIRRQERRRKAAREDLQEEGIIQPSPDAIEKWMLWEECGHRCPFTGDHISFDALFRTGEFEVEHIWPRSRSFDNGFRNKTLCRKDINIDKSNKIPFEYIGHDPEKWAGIVSRLEDMRASRGNTGMSWGKVRRFLATSIPEGFTERQLNDTGYAARESVAYLKKLWPDIGPEAPVNVFAVSGRVTGHLRRLWGLNYILADDGEKTRKDHRHHAIDALVVACSHSGMTQQLSRYWQAKDDPHASQPQFELPWKTIRADAEKIIKNIVVSHRVRKKLSGPLHKGTVYGDTEESVSGHNEQTYRVFVSRRNVEDLSKSDLMEKNKDFWPDQKLREIVVTWVNKHGDGDPKKAFPPYPKRGRKGPSIRRVRLRKRQQIDLMAKVSTGYADLGNNHHIAIYRLPDGKVDYEVVSLLAVSQRLARGQPVVKRHRNDQAKFLMSLSIGDALSFEKLEDEDYWVVNKLSANGQVSMRRHTDADKTGRLWSPSARTFAEKGARKISVDPIGRIRPAND